MPSPPQAPGHGCSRDSKAEAQKGVFQELTEAQHSGNKSPTSIILLFCLQETQIFLRTSAHGLHHNSQAFRQKSQNVCWSAVKVSVLCSESTTLLGAPNWPRHSQAGTFSPFKAAQSAASLYLPLPAPFQKANVSFHPALFSLPGTSIHTPDP